MVFAMGGTQAPAAASFLATRGPSYLQSSTHQHQRLWGSRACPPICLFTDPRVSALKSLVNHGISGEVRRMTFSLHRPHYREQEAYTHHPK